MQIGDQVHLKHDQRSVIGLLNSIFLDRHGYKRGPVPVIREWRLGYVVKLPSGYELRITERDVVNPMS